MMLAVLGAIASSRTGGSSGGGLANGYSRLVLDPINFKAENAEDYSQLSSSTTLNSGLRKMGSGAFMLNIPNAATRNVGFYFCGADNFTTGLAGLYWDSGAFTAEVNGVYTPIVVPSGYFLALDCDADNLMTIKSGADKNNLSVLFTLGTFEYTYLMIEGSWGVGTPMINVQGKGLTGGTTPPDPGTITKAELLSYFTYGYEAESARKSGGTVAGSGEVVDTMPAVVGADGLTRGGTNTPNLTGRLPKRFDTDGTPYVFMANIPDTYVSSIGRPTVYPLEIMFKCIHSNFFMFEALFNVFNFFYYGETNGGTRIRFNPSPNENEYVDFVIPRNRFYVVNLVATGANADSTKTTIELYINNVRIGGEKALRTDRKLNLEKGFGATSNNAHWGLSNLYYKMGGTLTPENRTKAAEYLLQGAGTGIKAAYATNVVVVNLGAAGFRVDYDYFSPLGLEQDDSVTLIEWIQGDSVQTSEIIEGQNSATIAESEVTKNWLRAEVSVGDNTNNFMYIPQSDDISTV